MKLDDFGYYSITGEVMVKLRDIGVKFHEACLTEAFDKKRTKVWLVLKNQKRPYGVDNMSRKELKKAIEIVTEYLKRQEI